MLDDSPHWQDVGEPATPAEAEALDAIKAILPDASLVWAWSNLSFISVNGRMAEVDLLLLTRSGLTVVELKGLHGRITGNQGYWRHNGRELKNPIHATNDKAKWLKGVLEHEVTRAGGNGQFRIPFVESITVLHGRDSKVDLDSLAKQKTYGLDGFNVQGLPLFTKFLDEATANGPRALDMQRAKAVKALLESAGFAAPARVRMVGHYAVDRAEPADQGPTWSDVIAEHPNLTGVRKRIRLYDIPRGASAERRQQITRSARREYELTSGLKHPGVVAPEDFFEDPQAGPALQFAYDGKAQRLDRWLEANSDSLTLDRRLELVRQVAEVLRYAHGRGVTHRALTPRQVFVTQAASGEIRASIRDWQTGRETPGTQTGTAAPQPTLLQGTRHVADMAAQETWVYLAPEIYLADEPDGVALDVYGLGALTYLLLTLQPPATSMADLEQRIRGSRGLDPAIDLDGVPESLRQLVMRATHPDARMDRTPDIAAFLADLDKAELELHAGQEPEPVLDPLEAIAGSVLGDRFIVQSRLGSGSTGLALLVNDLTLDEAEKSTVLKIAHDETKAERLQHEYEILASLESARIVKPIGEPFNLDGRRCLQLENAGLPTLGTRIRDEGRLTFDQLERYGGDLLEAAAHLEARGVLHRDIKPDNLGVRPDSSGRPRIVLFDFSLSREPIEQVRAGTPPYLDPFLGGGRRPRYDRAAERFAIAVTLFEMAAGEKPVWGSGEADPATIADEVNLAPDMFEAPVASAMMAFFRKALARDSAQRFGDLSELAQSWAQMFRAIDASTSLSRAGADGDESGDIEALDVPVTLSTPLVEAGFSARALSALARLDVATVGELLAISQFRVNSISGIGGKTRREIKHRLRDWRRNLVAEQIAVTVDESQEPELGRGIDRLVHAFVPRATGRNATQVRTASLLLGLRGPDDMALEPWPNLTEIARHLDVTPPRVSQIVDDLRTAWRKLPASPELAEEIESIVSSQGGVAESFEVARALLARHGSAAVEPDRTLQAIGLVRATLESDLARGVDSRFSSSRIGPRMVIALEPSDPQAPPADAILDYVRQLATVADRLADRPVVALRAEAVDALRSIAAPERMQPFTDDRLQEIAAAASKRAARGSRGEIYPVGLNAGVALRLTLAGSAFGRLHLTPLALRQRVSARFQAAEALPDRPDLDSLVEQVDPSLRWDGTVYTMPTSVTDGLLQTRLALTMLGAGGEVVPFNEVDTRLRGALASAGYLTLTVDPRRIDQAASVLAEEYGVTRVNITDVLLSAVKEFAVEKGVDWTFLLRVDSADPSSVDRSNLTAFVREALDRALPDILALEQPLLLTDTAPLGRYGQEHWLARLADLGAPRPAARWHLVPFRVSDAAPTLDSAVLVPLGADGWVPITAEFIGAKRTGTRTARFAT